jgi:peptidoglycan/LPS O-acetylase OafA/YrhL
MMGQRAAVVRQPAAGSSERTGFDLVALDGLRGLTALYVVMLHARVILWVGPRAALAGGASLPMTAFALLAVPFRYGTQAVLVFFLISGFVIHFRQASALARGETPHFEVGGFLFRRARRLMPALVFGLALTAALDLIGAAVMPSRYAAFTHSPVVLAGNVFFLQRLVTATFGSNGALWSLSYEGVFYLIYPALLAARLRFGMRAAFGAAFAVGLAGCAANLVTPSAAVFIAPYFAIWAMGALVAELFARRASVRPMPMLALGVLLITCSLLVRGGHGAAALNAMFGTGAALVFGVLVLHRWGHRAGGALVKFRALGACSYTLYVTHVPILVLMAAAYSSQFGGLPRAGWLAAAGVMVAVAFAFAVAPVAELPFVSKRAEAEGALPARRGRWASTAAGGATGASQEVDDERLAA